MINRSENICGILSRLNFKNLFCYVSIENIIVLRWLIKQMWIFFLIFQFAYFIYTFTRLSICEIDRSKKVAFPRFQSAEIRHVGISTVTFLTCMDLLCQYFILHMNNIHVLNKKNVFLIFVIAVFREKLWIQIQYVLIESNCNIFIYNILLESTQFLRRLTTLWEQKTLHEWNTLYRNFIHFFYSLFTNKNSAYLSYDKNKAIFN